MTTMVGIQKSSNLDREGVYGLFDHFITLLQDKLPTIAVIYGNGPRIVSPFYTASFVKEYHNFPAVAMTVITNKQTEVGIGQMAAGSTIGEQSGMHNLTHFELDVWATNRNELEAVSNAVMDCLQRYKKELISKGIWDYKLFRTYDRPYDPNAPRMWYGSTQAPGEIWLKMLEYTVEWDYVWGPVEEEYYIKKIEAYLTQEAGTQTFELGLVMLGLLDSMYLIRFLDRGVKMIRTGGRH